VLFIDALASEEEMRAFCKLGGAAAGVPKVRRREGKDGGGRHDGKLRLRACPVAMMGAGASSLGFLPSPAQMANMLEGGGKTPILSPEELQGMGFSLVAYPLSL
jgi:hypothetical protein